LILVSSLKFSLLAVMEFCFLSNHAWAVLVTTLKSYRATSVIACNNNHHLGQSTKLNNRLGLELTTTAGLGSPGPLV